MTQDSVADTIKRLNSISFAVLTDPGRKREENQDAFGSIEGHSIKVFMVADGMGGARGGAIASGLAIDLIKSSLRGQEEISCSEISAVISQANTAIQEKGTLDLSLSGMGTTLVGIAFDAVNAFVFNVGDSRLYRLTKDSFSVVTEDHTLVQELLRSGAIEPEQAKNHPVSHMLTRSLGPSAEVKVDCFRIEDGLFCGEKFLICSDGLHNQASSEELELILRNNSKEEAVKLLVDLANERGGPDNITVMIVELGDEFPIDSSSAKDLGGQIFKEVLEVSDSSQGVGQSNPGPEASAFESCNTSANISIPAKNNKILLLGLVALILVSICSAFIVLGFALFHNPGGSTNPELDSLGKQLDSIVTPEAVSLSSKAPISQTIVVPAITATTAISSSIVKNPDEPGANVVITPVPIVALIGEQRSDKVLEGEPEKLDAHAVLASGEKAILGRQEAIRQKIALKGEQIAFISLPEQGRNQRLQALNDSKTSLLAQKSLIQTQLNSTKALVSENEKLLEEAKSAEPIGMARRLSSRFPKVFLLYKNFEVATDQYLKALETRKASPQSPEAASALGFRLAQRTESVNSLKAGLEVEISQTLNQNQEQLAKLESELNDIEQKQTDNDQQRMEFSAIANADRVEELAAIQAQLNQDLQKLKDELALLSR